MLNIEVGIKVRVSLDIEKSINELGGGGDRMRSMAGGEYEVINTSEMSIHLDGQEIGTWWFLREDVKISISDEELNQKIKDNFPPVMFDPENIVNEGE